MSLKVSLFKRFYDVLRYMSPARLRLFFLRRVMRLSSPELASIANAELVLVRQRIRALSACYKNVELPELWWANKPYPGNLGDSLNPHLLSALTGMPIKRVSTEGDGMMMIGSTIERAKDHCHIWGSGLISQQSSPQAKLKLHSVRGPLTQNRLKQLGYTCPEVFGDPAILMPVFFPMRDRTPTRIGVIPHFQHSGRHFKGDIELISVNRGIHEDFEAFVEQLSRCSFVFSSSLHGLILSRAYRIPCARVIFEQDQLSGDDSKFADYRLGVGLTNPDFVKVNYQPNLIWNKRLVESLDPD